MKVLVACEESQRVCIAFRKRGHEAYSCDLQECSGGHPEWHILGDCLPIIGGGTEFTTMDGRKHRIDGKWDLLIAHPPCTDLAVSGAAWFKKKRADGRQRASIELFCKFLTANCECVAIENPVGIISGDYMRKWFPDICTEYGLPKKYTQVIQPFQFGHKVSKKTCLWLRGLPKLEPTDIVEPEWKTDKNGKRYSGAAWYAMDDSGKILAWDDPRTAKARSRTFEGIANAMAEQWAEVDE